VTVVRWGSTGPRTAHGTRVNRLGHRPALDGLRAVAVLAVVASHTWPAVVPGGGAGVDLFFVLSGFLITTLLLEEHASAGVVSLARFYARRALRLLPALAAAILFAVVLVTAFAPELLHSTIADGVATAADVSNWPIGFQADAHQASFLAYTWSLSLEEQYYLAWPLLLCILLRLGGRHAALGVTLTAIVLVSVHRLVMGMTVGLSPDLYYRTDTRADTLLVGSALALMPTWRARPQVRWAATAVLVATALGYRGPSAYPIMVDGGFLLVAVAAAGVVTSSVTAAPWRALRWSPLVGTGRISYGIYLYHYPISRVVHDWMGIGPTCLVVTLLLTLALSTLSYRYLERPFLRLKGRVAAPQPAAPAPVPIPAR
jgi:peptidoglycan/LPS O-acetylase OafA/YrhL